MPKEIRMGSVWDNEMDGLSQAIKPTSTWPPTVVALGETEYLLKIQIQGRDET